MSPHFQLDTGDDEVFDLYLLGGLEEAEREQVAEHLNRNCPACRQALAGARTRHAALGLAAPAAEPSAHVKRELMAKLRPVPAGAAKTIRVRPGWNWIWGGLAGVLAVLCLLIFGRMRDLRARESNLQSDLAASQEQLRDALAQAAQLRFATALMAAPETRTLAVKAAPSAPQGHAYMNPRRGVVLVVDHMPPAPSARTYEMWLLPSKGKPIRAGEFQSSPAGTAIHSYAQPFSDMVGVAVSVEPSGGSDQPTGAIVLAAKVAP